MANEQNPSAESTLQEDAERIIDGNGFNELGQAIITKRYGVIRHIEEQRPLYLVVDAPDESKALTNYLETILTQRLYLPPNQADLISAYYAGHFGETSAQGIITDRRRPAILPMLIGQGTDPPWRIGPLWMFYTMNNYLVFKEQLRGMAH